MPFQIKSRCYFCYLGARLIQGPGSQINTDNVVFACLTTEDRTIFLKQPGRHCPALFLTHMDRFGFGNPLPGCPCSLRLLGGAPELAFLGRAVQFLERRAVWVQTFPCIVLLLEVARS